MADPAGATRRIYGDEAHAINARDVHFDFDSVPLHYIPGEVLATHIVNVMHLVLPEGERAMAQALSEALPLIDDERLREEVIGFVGQETMHARSHEAARDHLQSLGLDVDSYVRAVAWLVDRILGDHGLTGRAKQEWLKERLGLFAGMEHYTAVLGEWLLEAEVLEAKGMHPAMLDLVRWHGAEEVEHRSVVYDAYMHVDGGYARKARTALLASLTLLPLFIVSTGYLYRKDPEADKGRFWLRQFVSATRRGVIPKWTVFLTEVPRYLRPGFHPSQLGPMDTALRYLAHSPAARAAGH
ncbi:metal-dependent hydrolase [Nocardia huaxiensis]|uniref:Metal-dependent hydrolase n=1 Tax=Nocardia huaxiensis TaxID=2755382 RepID=A0A7D6VFZ6_9NOCA|nr:metal-dependent hydrolase [Nocardia huaxiensis]QLY28750.1 metal-dependent hydrolase [Nocardia huaxiensis]UFS97776.1 metal-dependent hydrolase [Nocardia huaxiensis]